MNQPSIPPPPGAEPGPDSPVLARPVTTAVARRAAMYLDGLCRRDAVLDLALVLMTAVIAQFAPTAIALFDDSAGLELEAKSYVLVIKWAEAAMVVAMLAYFVLRHRIDPRAFGVRFDRPAVQFAWGLLALIGAYGAIVASIAIVQAVVLFWPGAMNDVLRRVEFTEQLGDFSLWQTLVLLAGVSIHEEVLFRALLIPYLRRATGRWWAAVVLSSAVFAVLHFPQGWIAVVQIFGLSAVFSTMFIVSRSLPALCLAHLAFNLAQLSLMRLLDVGRLRELLERAVVLPHIAW